jgi:tetratricopeptide (TPR) repeat protein
MDNSPEARKSYNKGLEISSKCDQCEIGIGRLDLDANKLEDARKHFETALKGNSKNAVIQGMVGMAYLYNKKPMPEAALEYLSKARDLDPKQSKFWIYLGDSYQAKGDLGNAMTSYETAVEKDKNDPETMVKMARIWAGTQQPDLAIEQLEKAIKSKPDYAIAYKDLYELYIRTGKFDKVVPILEKYISLIGSDVDAKIRFVKFLCFQAKDYARAIDEGTKLLVSNPEQYTLHRWLSWSYYEKADYKNSLQEGLQLFDEIKKDSVNRKAFPSDYEYAAKAAAKLSMMDTAELFFVKLMQLQADRKLEITSIIAKAFYDAKKYEKTEFWYQEKAKLAALTPTELLYLGLAQKNLGKLLQADSTFAQILVLTPKYENGWYYRAKINGQLDTTEKKLFLAKPYYEKFVELASASTDPSKWQSKLIEAYMYLAFYFVQNDNNELAKSYCNMVLNLEPENENAKEYLKILNGPKEKKK